MQDRELNPPACFSYVVAEDYGFAPNPFYGFCTLATCKPKIRKAAKVGDWIIGTGSKKTSREEFLVYVMRVAETMTYNEYWEAPRFLRKRPYLRGSNKQAFGDNIYYHDGRKWCQQDSHHSKKDGTPEKKNIKHDTKTDRVLIGTEYAYWGEEGPRIPSRFRDYGDDDICKKGPGHKCRFSEKLVAEFVAWFRCLSMQGCLGRPLKWPKRQ